MRNHLRHLATFADVVETGSITAAADRLGVSPSVVSASLRAIEAYFREPLVERRRSGVVVTPRGERVYRHARDIVASARAALDRSADDVSGAVRVSVPSELSNGWFDNAIGRLSAAHPSLVLKLFSEDAVVDQARQSRDIFVSGGQHPDRRPLEHVAVAQVPIVFVAAPALLGDRDPNDAEALSDAHFLAAIRVASETVLDLDGGATAITFRRVIQADSIRTRIALARAGHGVTGCLAPTVVDDLAEGRLVRLFAKRFSAQATLTIATAQKRTSTAVATVAEAFAADLEATASRTAELPRSPGSDSIAKTEAGSVRP